MNNKKYTIFALVISCLGNFSSITAEEAIPTAPTIFTLEKSKFSIELPSDWKQETDEKMINKLVINKWRNFNHSVWAERTLMYCWTLSDESAFVTVQAFKRDRTRGSSTLYNDIIGNLKEKGFSILKQDTMTVDNENTRWWIQEFKDQFTQQCAFIPHLDQIYYVEFTTDNFSQKKIEEYQSLLRTIKFL